MTCKSGPLWYTILAIKKLLLTTWMFPVPNFNLQLKNNKEQLVKEQLLILCKEMGEMITYQTGIRSELSSVGIWTDLTFTFLPPSVHLSVPGIGTSIKCNGMGGMMTDHTRIWTQAHCIFSQLLYQLSYLALIRPIHSSPPKWSSPLKITTPGSSLGQS